MITELKDNEVFVMGTNSQGFHGAGAARFAYDKGWTKTGHAHGLMWKSFAIDTMDGEDMFKMDLQDLAITAISNPALTFYLTPVGQGIAGYSKEQVLEMMPKMPSNVIFTDDWNEQ